MKRIAVFASVVAIAGFARALQETGVDSYGNDGYNADLAGVVGLGATADTDASFALDIAYGVVRSTYGLGLGVVGRNTGDMYGLQLQAGVSWTEGDKAGFGVSVLSNVRRSNAYGVDISAALNYTRGYFGGFQLSLVNFDGEFCGAQFGLYNHDKGQSAGFQLGVANTAASEFAGWSFGVVNYAETFDGFQLGVVNCVAGAATGLQIGVFNGAGNLGGVQIGLLNLVEQGAVPVMPVLNANF